MEPTKYIWHADGWYEKASEQNTNGTRSPAIAEAY